MLRHAAQSVLLIITRPFVFINIHFLIFLCQSPRRPVQVFYFFMNNTEDGRLTAAETGSFCNDCPQCTLGNNQPSFVIIAGKYWRTDAVVLAVGRWQQGRPAVIFHFLFFSTRRTGIAVALWRLLVFTDAAAGMKRASRESKSQNPWFTLGLKYMRGEVNHRDPHLLFISYFTVSFTTLPWSIAHWGRKKRHIQCCCLITEELRRCF